MLSGSLLQQVSVDCEGPNREDRDGIRYSIMYFDCLSYALLLEPVRSLTHADVRKAFLRCILRSRTLPKLIRLGRGSEFKNAMMAELSAMLGANHQFSMALRPCEMGPNERVREDLWDSPKPGRVPWKPGLTGPWRIISVKGSRLQLELVSGGPGGTGQALRGACRGRGASSEGCRRARKGGPASRHGGSKMTTGGQDPSLNMWSRTATQRRRRPVPAS